MTNFETEAQQILALIKNSNPIIIHRHIHPDGDALGSQWGLKHLIETNFVAKKVLLPGEDNLQMKQLFPAADVVTEEDYQNDSTLVIVCDTANRERISGEFYFKAKNIVKIDHHVIVDQYASTSLVDDTASSNCEVIVRLAKHLQWEISQAAANALYIGLITDSGRFLYRSVSNKTFTSAATLINTGIDITEIYQKLYQQTEMIARIKAYILANFKITKHGLAYFCCNYKQLKKLEKWVNKKITNSFLVSVTSEDITSQVNLLSSLNNVHVWAIASQSKKRGEFKVSVRSTKIVINTVLMEFNGGGHRTAAGVKLKSEKDVLDLLSKLETQIDNNKYQ